ncbi:MAG: beta-lactamase family protein [Rhodothermales bacterium]|nr:beta-lactamase family protein [Rhodothermales bacterium]
MMNRYCLPALLLVGLLSIAPAHAQDGPPPEIRELIDALMDAINDSNDESLGVFIATRVHPDHVGDVGNEALEDMLRKARAAARGAGDIGVGRTDRGLEVSLHGGPQEVTVAMDIPFASPNLITRLSVDVGETSDPMAPPGSLEEAIPTRARAVESIWSPGPDRKSEFVEMHVDPSIHGPDLDNTVSLIQTIGAASGAIAVSPTDRGVQMELRGPRSLRIDLTVSDSSPYLITALEAVEIESTRLPPPPELAWDTLESELEDAVEDGFSGSVLAARDGAMVVHRGFGPANSDGNPITLETVFDIGSMPIDFTRAAVLLMAQRGLVDLDASIAEYLPSVPSEKAGILLTHLMRGESGLPNYHHINTDRDADLTWISRDEAVSRILTQELLFPPGQGEAHSHSAWTLLAAIVERVSGTPYPEFLQTHFFDPAGMEHTGFYGPTDRFDPADQAAGFGGSRPSDPNIPLNWGPTSWLVMGGGGMVSNPTDLYRWHNFIRREGPLTATSRAWLPAAGVFMGDSDRGFLTVAGFSEGAIVIACTNRFNREGDPSHQVMRGLARLGQVTR